jgi:hypothetical protein
MKEFRFESAALERSYPWTRLVVYFRRDADPRLLYAFWAPIWELVAFDQIHNPTSEPWQIISSFCIGFEDEQSIFGSPSEGATTPETEMGDRWIRAKVVW